MSHFVDQWTVHLMGALGAFVPPPPGRWPETRVRLVSDPQNQEGACQAYLVFQDEGGFSRSGTILSM